MSIPPNIKLIRYVCREHTNSEGCVEAPKTHRIAVQTDAFTAAQLGYTVLAAQACHRSRFTFRPPYSCRHRYVGLLQDPDPAIALRFHVLTWFGCTLCLAAISWIALSPRSASSVTFALKAAVNRRRVVIVVFLRQSVEYTLTSCPIFRDHLNRMLGRSTLNFSFYLSVSQTDAWPFVKNREAV